MLHASRAAGVQPIWDLCHYGWPDDIDIWQPNFIDRLANFAAAAAKLVRDETPEVPFYSVINEISYWAWAGGDTARFNPMARGRGTELKVQLVRASIAAIEAIRNVDSRARFVQIDPVINVVPKGPGDRGGAEGYRQAQFQAWDMLVGKIWPGLGGKPEYLDIIGVNYYSDNQWFFNGPTIERTDPHYRPFRELLAETHKRYGKPVLVAERGRGRTTRFVVQICVRRGRGGAGSRRAGGRHLPLSRARLLRLGRRSSLCYRSAGSSRCDGTARGACSARRRTGASAGSLRAADG